MKTGMDDPVDNNLETGMVEHWDDNVEKDSEEASEAAARFNVAKEDVERLKELTPAVFIFPSSVTTVMV